MNEIEIIQPQSIDALPARDYDSVIKLLLSGVSDKTARQYFHTYHDWRSWCKSENKNLTDMSAPNVYAYLYHKPLSRSTRMSRLSHFRVLVKMLRTIEPHNRDIEAYCTQLTYMKLSIDDIGEKSEKGKKRKGQRIDANKVHELINSYPATKDGKPYMRGLRNRALLAVLFYSGLRRFEAAKIKWEDIDFEKEYLVVIGGKGRARDAAEYVPFIGSIARHLLAWREYTQGRIYVFPRVLKGDHLGQDKPITPDAIYKQVQDDFAPHDARRTLISDLLDSGTYIGDVKAIARHTSEVTTLKYAMPHKVQEIKGRVKISY